MPEYEITFRKEAAKGRGRHLTTHLHNKGYRDISYRPAEDDCSAVFTTDRPLDAKIFGEIRTSHHAIGLKRLE